jgi:hypothetical protein
MYPILLCPDLGVAVAFYEALGFAVTYQQTRPNPYAVVALEEMAVHLAEVPEHDPKNSTGSVIVTVPDADDLRSTFAAGLRTAYGRVPVEGIPRLLRVRRKAGTATGFSAVDPGGNWLRFYPQGAQEESSASQRSGLARVIDVAARQAEARGEDEIALAKLTSGIERYVDAPAADRIEAHTYRAELLVRLGSNEQARAELDLVDALLDEHAGSVEVPADTLAELRAATT